MHCKNKSKWANKIIKVNANVTVQETKTILKIKARLRR